MFSLTSYLILGVVVAGTFLFWLMNYYKTKSQQLERDLQVVKTEAIRLQKELSDVQIKQQIERDNAVIPANELDERLHEQGYLRDE